MPKTGNISKRDEMPLKGIIEVENFVYLGIDFKSSFPLFNYNVYILVCVDYVTKLVKALASVANNA